MPTQHKHLLDLITELKKQFLDIDPLDPGSDAWTELRNTIGAVTREAQAVLMQPNTVNPQRLERVLSRWEQAVYEQESGDFEDVDRIAKELTESREAVLDLLRDAKVVADNPDSIRWEYVIGKKLKDWATALMQNRGITREAARLLIEASVEISTAREYPALMPNVHVPHDCKLGCTIAPLDHLPEGSH